MNTIEKAAEAVNAAVKPYGFSVVHTNDSIIDSGELWFILSDGEDSPAFFEAVYYVSNDNHNHKKIGDIVYGIMDGEWSDLPDDAKSAVEMFKKYRVAKRMVL